MLDPRAYERSDSTDMPTAKLFLDMDFKVLTDFFLKEMPFIGGEVRRDPHLVHTFLFSLSPRRKMKTCKQPFYLIVPSSSLLIFVKTTALLPVLAPVIGSFPGAQHRRLRDWYAEPHAVRNGLPAVRHRAVVFRMGSSEKSINFDSQKNLCVKTLEHVSQL